MYIDVFINIIINNIICNAFLENGPHYKSWILVALCQCHLWPSVHNDKVF